MQSNARPATAVAEDRARTNGAGDPSANGHVDSDSPFPSEGGPEVQAKAILDRRCTQWRARHYDVAVLDRPTEGWARKLTSKIAHENAHRDPEKKLPTLMFSGADAVNAGATDNELAAMPPLSDDEIVELKVRAASTRSATWRSGSPGPYSPRTAL